MEKYLLVKGMAGLGNRIFALVTAIIYARMSGRTLVVDWRDGYYADPGENAFVDLFEVKNLPFTQNIPYSDSIYPSLWKGHIDRSINSFVKQDRELFQTMGQDIFRKKYAYDVSQLSYSEDIIIASGFTEEIERARAIFSGNYEPLRKTPKHLIFKDVFHQHLFLVPSIQSRIDEFKQKNFAGKQTIGIHIRKSDKSISYGWYKKALADYVEKYPNAQIFLATDNRDVESDLRSIYSNVLTSEKWLPLPGIRAHGNQDCPNLREHAVEALVDIFLLASCEHLIYSRTTSFGLLASYIALDARSHFDIQTYEDKRKRKPWVRIETLMGKLIHKFKYYTGSLRLKGAVKTSID